ncbi:ABC transporter permease [Thiohalomonas denitrificans]|uniref:ABC transporter permease n=1 Tax=Thiohalomonas denitrificans TaxID=415747 RepID=UPI0026EB84B2|nr:ABC transporter permease [Thiohalomonas denitrificans]
MDLAIKDVRRHLGKFLATIAGVGMLVAIVLIMNGIFQGNIADGIWLIENTRADLWVVERDRGGPFNESSRIPTDSYRSVAATPGVARASPFISYAVQREIGDREQQFTIIGYDVFGGLGEPGRIIAGRPIRRAHYELVADRKLGLALGQTLRLGVHDYTVVGLTRGAVDSGGNPLAYLSLPDAQEVLYQQDNRALEVQRESDRQRLEDAGYSSTEVERLLPLLGGGSATISAVLVALTPGADRDAVARHIERWLYLSAYTTEQERELMLEGKLKRMTAILGVFRTLLLAVAIVIIALLIYVLTMEKVRAIATLKIIGAGDGVIVRLILEQALVLTLGSFAFGWALTTATQDKFPRNLVLLPEETMLTFIIMLVGGVLASLMGIWHALRTPPSLALGG